MIKLSDGDDQTLEVIWNEQYPLKEFTAPTNFKSYDELKTRLNTVLAGTTRVGNATTLMEDEPVAKPTVDTKEEPAELFSHDRGSDRESDDESLDYFKKLAADG